MFCPNCGVEHTDSDKFCSSCGCNFETGESPVADKETKNSVILKINKSGEKKTKPEDQKYASIEEYTLSETKRLARSPLMIITVLVFILGTILNIYNDPITSLLDKLYFMNLGEAYDVISYVLGEGLYYVNSIGIDIGLILNLPSLLYSVALCLIVVSAFNFRKPKLSLSGFIIIKGIVIINFVFSILTCIAAFFLTFPFADEFEAMPWMLFLIFIIPIAVLLLTIMYNIGLISSINNIMDSSDVGIPTTDISGFIIFCCYFSGIVSVIANITEPVKLPAAVAPFLFGILLSKFKDTMQYITQFGKRHITTEK